MTARGDEGWRDRARRQRAAFACERSTVANVVFRDLGNGRTWRKKHAWIRTRLGWDGHGDGRYLELGTGEGQGHSAPASYPAWHVGADASGPAVARARRRWVAAGGSVAGHAWVAALGEGLPFAAASFAGVFGIDVLHHLADPGRALAELARVLRPGGQLAFVEPNPWFPVNLLVALSPLERGIYGLTRGNLARWAAAAGLERLEVGNVATYLPSVPSALESIYEQVERRLGRLPIVRRLSTGRTIVATRGARPGHRGGA